MELDTKRLLLSNQLGDLSLDPFCFFCVEDYLPEDLSETLVGRKAFMINVKCVKRSKRNPL